VETAHGASTRGPSRSLRVPATVALVLVVAVLAVFRDVSGFSFLNYDDDTYITKNHLVSGGLSPQSARWAFQSFAVANWHPLTWISHQLDVSLFGMDAGRHHLTSVALHAAGTALLFLALRALTGALWPAALVAALFGVHPLHVESVIWLSERKDLLCGLFWVLALAAHARYARRPGLARFLPVLAATALALLAKPMAVTLPFTLLLLDWWPLGRLGRPEDPQRWATLRRLLLEKLPLLVLVLLSCAATLHAQQAGGAVKTLEGFPFGLRVEVALLASAHYLRAAVLPLNLAVAYPYPAAPAALAVAGAAAFLCAASLLALRQAGRRPYLLCGWLWYLGTLGPVIGLVQVGVQPWADRYTYLPLVGIFVAAAWTAADAARRGVSGRAVLAATSAAALAALGVAAHAQASHWRDSVTLFERAVAVTTDNYVARYNLAAALLALNRNEEAVAQYREAVRLRPRLAEARNGLAFALAGAGKAGEAVEQYRLAKEFGTPAGVDPDARRREIERSVGQFAGSITNDVPAAEARMRLGLAAAAANRTEEAIGHFRDAVRLAPYSIEPRYDLALVLTRAGRHAEALTQYEELARLFPGRADLRELLRAARENR